MILMEKNTQCDNEIIATSETAASASSSDDTAESYLIAQEIRAEFSGPLPHPSILAKYEEILPGAATRIFKMAEEQASHRRDMEKKSLNLSGRDALLGIVLGFIIALSGIVGGILIIAFNPDSFGAVISGSAISGSSLIGIIRIFVIGSKKQESEKQENEKPNSNND